MTAQESRPVEIQFERDAETFKVEATLGRASIRLENTDQESDDDLATLVAALPGILNAVVETIESEDEEAARG